MALQKPVAIVGGGPVGIVLALFLNRFGIETVVFNTEETTYRHPRGSTHNSRTMEHYRTLGLAKQIRKLGLPLQHPRDIWYLTRLNGHELARIPMGSEQERQDAAANAEPTEQIVEPLVRANQMYVERFLFAHARMQTGITLRFGWHVTGLKEDAKGVTVCAENHGHTERWNTEYLVGCDGGQSFVRRTLGISYSGEAEQSAAFMAGRMISAHIQVHGLHSGVLRGREGWLYNILNPKQRILLFSLNGKDEFLMMANATTETLPDNLTLTGTMRAAIGVDLPVTILGRQAWTGGVACVANSYGQRRTFLAGDAAHLFSPTGGLGMNTGIDDAANLAWKLAASIDGWGGENLLATYETERWPIAVRNTLAARRHTQRLGNVRIPAQIEDATNEGAAARTKLGDLLRDFTGQFSAPGTELGARYDGSPITCSDRPPPHDDLVTYTPTSVAGGRLPHLWIDPPSAGRRSIFDLLGRGFSLIRVGKAAPGDGALREAARKLQIPMKTIHVPDEPAWDLYQTRLILVRPDQYIAWSGNFIPDNAHGLLCAVTGREAQEPKLTGV